MLSKMALPISHMILTAEQAMKQKIELFEFRATHDALTGLPNRTLFYEHLGQTILAGQRDRKPAALLIMDLNRFKEINHTLGHRIGDLLLQQVGPRMQGALKKSDMLARLGGDEFAVLLDVEGAEQATLIARNILKALEEPFVLDGLVLDIQASIGIALFPEHGPNADTLIQRADVAMYVAKRANSGYAVYDSAQDQNSPRRLALMGELRRAIVEDQLFLHYQPKIDLRTGRISGVEALVRWQHPRFGIILPDQFIPLAEQNGLIMPLTLWVLHEALRQCRKWHQAGLELSLAANLSVHNLQSPALPDQVAGLLETCGVAPASLGLEITESSIMADPTRAMEVLKRMSNMGLQFSIDDFGTGYSSLAYLKKLPVDEIKIDKSFVMNMALEEDDVVIVRSTIELGHNLGLKVVAEGVENQEIKDKLTMLGCDAAQGYYISRPLPAEELTLRLKKSAQGS